ncbi:MAG TPA: T9SS type A sorting domain-containing protein, partial [Puia sp.]
PPAPVISGLQAHYCPNAGAQQIKITNVPASTYQAAMVVKVDGAVTTLGSDSSFTIRPDTLAAGQHTVTVIFKNVTAADTSNWSFDVDPKVAPQVGLDANITNVTDLTHQVVLTATNMSGGGTTPLYTFGKDKNFTTIVRAEGAAATYILSPSTLQVGNNSFYVRMRTSETCYPAQTAVDSIVIVRSPVTGIVDVDYPDQVINIFSNPFIDRLHITGLQSFKRYTFTLVRSNGQVVLRRQVSGQQEANIETGVVAAGVYLLNIYDNKKGQLIGTAKLVSLGE